MKKIKKALTIHDIQNYSPKILPFSGAWERLIGQPEQTGSWIIWGNSGNGKTRFAFQLAKYLCSFCRVAYNSLEEGLSLSIQDAIAQVGMTDGEVKRNFTLLDKESIADIEVRLRHRRAPHVVIIDSVQYTGMTYADYKRLRDNNRHTIFIFISHAGGKEPKGEVAKSIRYDANVKINVEGFKATAQSRYGGGEEYVIWEYGARKIHNT